MSSGRAGATAEDARVARTRTDVARASLDVLTTDGFDELTHARVARLAGYSKTTLYTHWPSRVDLLTMALSALGELPHHTPTGDLRADLIAELHAFREAIEDLGLDRVLMVLAQWGASVEEIGRIRIELVTDGEHIARRLLSQVAEGVRLEAAVSMLSGVVICPTLMYGSPPDDTTVEHAIDILLAGLGVH
mgnify:CR=1 FL=1